MKRKLGPVIAALATLALFGGLVHAVLVASNLAEPAATTVYGPTTRRIWASVAALLALAGIASGGLAWRRSAGQGGAGKGRNTALVALGTGFLAVINGGLNLALAKGGPGTGNGVVGAAGALVLGLAAIVLGGLALSRSRRFQVSGIRSQV